MSDWRVYVDAVSGLPYYHSKRLRRTTWTQPKEFTEEAARLTAMQQRASGVTSSRTVQILQKQGDWMSAVDPASGDVYYFHRRTKTACWDPPPGWEAAGVVGASEGRSAAEEANSVSTSLAQHEARAVSPAHHVDDTVFSSVAATDSSAAAADAFVCDSAGFAHVDRLPAPPA